MMNVTELRAAAAPPVKTVAPAAAPPRLIVRKAEPADVTALRELFAVRSRTDEASSTDSRGPELDKPGRMLWAAFDGNRAVGMTSVQERRLRVSRMTLRMAYWTGLFVDPEYRTAFVYPRLLSAMFSGIREKGMCALYAAVRRQPIADAHVKIGFTRIGDMRVLAKPLRPASLLAKYKGLLHGRHASWLSRLCRVPDAAVGFGIGLRGPRARPPWCVEEMAWTPAVADDLACLRAAVCTGSAAQVLTGGSLAARYGAPDREYRVIGVRLHDRLVASVILRIVNRFDGIRAAVVMDLFCEPELPRAAGLALAAAERLALDRQCDVALALDGFSLEQSRMVRGRGYIPSPEKYALLLWRDRREEADPLPADLRSWRFTFGDHDTF